MLKRLFDVVISATLLVCLAPLFLLIAVAIKLESSGPVIFRQERVGRGGRHFHIHKFRTMQSSLPRSGPRVTIGMDPRITRVGRRLRRLKLDELPQLLDVVKGHMSLVGPRPELPNYVRLYPEEVRRKVLSVAPGMTDMASLQFFDEADYLGSQADPERTYVEVILPKKLELAVRYVDRQSLCLDIQIIMKTVLRILGGGRVRAWKSATME